MKGRILDYSLENNTGIISGDNGVRYSFVGTEWKEESIPQKGVAVDFDVSDSKAVSIYRNLGTTAEPASTSRPSIGGAKKDKVAAGVLAILLGYLGIHKFYLGYNVQGAIFLLVNTVGWAITWMLFGLPNIILGAIAVVEGIIYLTKSDEEFQRTYVEGSKPWF